MPATNKNRPAASPGIAARPVPFTGDVFQLLTESAGDPLLIFDLHGRVIFSNRAAEEAFKTPAGRFLGKHFDEFVLPGSRRNVREAFDKALSSVQCGVEVDTIGARGERIPFEVTFSPVVQRRKVVAVHTTGRDLRPRRQLEHLQIEAEKMKAMQFFVAGTALELEHPLLAILTQIRALLQGYQDRDFEYVGFKEFQHIIQALGDVSRQVQYCYDTIGRLVNLHKRRLRMGAACCEANAIIAGFIRQRKGQFASAGIHCRLSLSRRAAQIAIGEVEFSQIIQNVVNNAVQAMPSGGRLVVRTRLLPKERQLRVEVRDDGAGIPSDILPHIFEPFYTTQPRGLGRHSGLGLTIVYALIQSCRSAIKVDSDLRRGTSVKMFFPLKVASRKGRRDERGR